MWSGLSLTQEPQAILLSRGHQSSTNNWWSTWSPSHYPVAAPSGPPTHATWTFHDCRIMSPRHTSSLVWHTHLSYLRGSFVQQGAKFHSMRMNAECTTKENWHLWEADAQSRICGDYPSIQSARRKRSLHSTWIWQQQTIRLGTRWQHRCTHYRTNNNKWIKYMHKIF